MRFQAYDNVYDLRFVSLLYFSAAGADESGVGRRQATRDLD